MKKKLLPYLFSIIIGALIVILLFSVYVIGGLVGAYAWTFALFIGGPLGLVLLLIQLVILIVKAVRKKNIKITLCNVLISGLLFFPFLILSGVVTVTYPTSESAEPKLKISSPIKGDMVIHGGKDYRIHAIWPSECYAYDILLKPHDTGSKDLKSYGIYGKDLLSPVSGEVIGVHDSEKDIEPNTDEFTSSNGNYIYIKAKDTGTYLILAHLLKDSITVKVGDNVSPGDVIAKIGNSGTTSEPHLHIQHQRNDPRNMPFPTAAEGLPMILDKN